MIARSVIFKLNHSMNEMCVYSYFEIKDQQSDEPNKLVMFLSCRNFAQSINVMAKLVFFFFFFWDFRRCVSPHLALLLIVIYIASLSSCSHCVESVTRNSGLNRRAER